MLLETARLEFLEGHDDAGRTALDAAKTRIDELGCHCWDREVRELEG